MSKLSVCVVVVLVLLLALAEGRPKCCTRYRDNPLPPRVLKYYRIQKDTEYCNIRAVIFMTVKNKVFCANPDRKWVQRAMRSISDRRP